MVTDLPGQSMIKEAEARAFLADPAPDMANYPMLSAEVGISAPDVETLAQHDRRLSFAAAIDAAATGTEADAVMVSIKDATWKHPSKMDYNQ